MSRYLSLLNLAFVPVWLQLLHLLHATTVTPLPYDLYDGRRWVWSALLAVAVSVSAFILGIPELAASRVGALGRMALSLAAGLVLVSLVQTMVGAPLLPRFVIAVAVASLLPWSVIIWNLWSDGSHRQASTDRVFAVVQPQLDADLRADLGSNAAGARVTLVGTGSAGELEGDGTNTPLVDLAESLGTSVLILDGLAQARPAIVSQAATLHERGVRVRTLSLFYEQWLGKLPIAELERVGLMFDIQELHRRQYGRAKRFVDSAVALSLVPLFLVAGSVAWLGNLVTDRGALLYRQQRVGKDGVPFEILKFRTMASVAEGDRGDWTSEDDQRVTPVGSVLRKTHLDELPQIVNIFRGQLSIVGPRPEQPAYVEDLAAKMEFYPLRHLVRPGLTGWAQVNLGYTATESDAFDKLQYDFYYLRHQSLWVDLRVLARTTRLSVLLGGR